MNYLINTRKYPVYERLGLETSDRLAHNYFTSFERYKCTLITQTCKCRLATLMTILMTISRLWTNKLGRRVVLTMITRFYMEYRIDTSCKCMKCKSLRGSSYRRLLPTQTGPRRRYHVDDELYVNTEQHHRLFLGVPSLVNMCLADPFNHDVHKDRVLRRYHFEFANHTRCPSTRVNTNVASWQRLIRHLWVTYCKAYDPAELFYPRDDLLDIKLMCSQHQDYVTLPIKTLREQREYDLDDEMDADEIRDYRFKAYTHIDCDSDASYESDSNRLDNDEVRLLN